MNEFDEKMQKLNTLITDIARRASINTEFRKEKLDIIDMFQDQQRDFEALLMVMNMPRQHELNRQTEELIGLYKQWADGLMTINEYKGQLLKALSENEYIDLGGLICPIHSYRFPTNAETDTFMKEFE